MNSSDGSSTHRKALAAREATQLGVSPTVVDHADAAGTVLLTAPAGVTLVCQVYVQCTENVAGATFLLGVADDTDLYDDGTKHGVYDAATEWFVQGLELAAGASLVATPSVAGTAGKYSYTVLSQAVS